MIEYGFARKKHINGLLELFKQLFPNGEPISKETAKKTWENIERQGIKYLIAVDGNKVVATLYMVVIPVLAGGGKNYGFIGNLITDAQYRRKGIGKKLIRMAIEYGKESNCSDIALMSGMHRKEAHEFYKGCGFDGNSKLAFEKRI
jgi:GNAT superfamily N-acetyltransferase